MNDDIQTTLRRLRSERDLWREEYEAYGGPGGRSAMKKSDIRFVEVRIARLEKLQHRVARECAKARAEVDGHLGEGSD